MSEKTYRIGEAAALLNLKTYVLRFWEVEFPQISPLRTEKGQRLYREEDVSVLRRIRYLLHERGLTIEGARRILAEEGKVGLEGIIERDLSLLSSGEDTEEAPDIREDDDASLICGSPKGTFFAVESGEKPAQTEDLRFLAEMADELKLVRELLVTARGPESPGDISGNAEDKTDAVPTRILFLPPNFE